MVELSHGKERPTGQAGARRRSADFQPSPPFWLHALAVMSRKRTDASGRVTGEPGRLRPRRVQGRVDHTTKLDSAETIRGLFD